MFREILKTSSPFLYPSSPFLFLYQVQVLLEKVRHSMESRFCHVFSCFSCIPVYLMGRPAFFGGQTKTSGPNENKPAERKQTGRSTTWDVEKTQTERLDAL